jgi:hypothetical protein
LTTRRGKYFVQKIFPFTRRRCNNCALQKKETTISLVQVSQVMWIEKLTGGVLELETPIGSRYLQPSLLERAFLLWTFRNFCSLPQSVLRPWERRLVDRLWSDNKFVSLTAPGMLDRQVIGKLERRPPQAAVEVMPLRKPATTSDSTEPSREAASA